MNKTKYEVTITTKIGRECTYYPSRKQVTLHISWTWEQIKCQWSLVKGQNMQQIYTIKDTIDFLDDRQVISNIKAPDKVNGRM